MQQFFLSVLQVAQKMEIILNLDRSGIPSYYNRSIPGTYDEQTYKTSGFLCKETIESKLHVSRSKERFNRFLDGRNRLLLKGTAQKKHMTLQLKLKLQNVLFEALVKYNEYFMPTKGTYNVEI
ncbi:hypothetical protein CWI39_0852p0020 [Hamiltosporidium magnivora]|uniref:Uncharacterized protein n=1 Tax=Hamiltosporidium magnivora TaxID=148818 RepID=A0A4Q9L8T8_9MICR|nr:hypothetical protein CWI39_0852p0020 [Hamiltosporidium magnivora]TBU08165.1 hypothetical protein CWI36_0174p0050 [Hamiltosporidium magnivora]